MSETITASSIDNEKMVLGAMLNNKENAKSGLKLVRDEDFFDPKHKIILKAIQDVFSEKGVVDITLIRNKLVSEDKLESVGGLQYLITLPQIAGTSTHIEAYCDDLRVLTKKRQLLALYNSLANDLTKDAEPTKILTKLKAQIQGIEENHRHGESAFRYLLDNNSELQIIEEFKNLSPGISTGFTIGDIELKIPGGALTIIAAPTGHGKTTTLINFAIGALNHHYDKSVYFFSYEENGASILSLFLNTWIGKEISKNNRKSIEDHFRNENENFIKIYNRETFLKEKKAFFENRIDNGRLRVFYTDMSTEELVASIRFLKKNNPNIGLVCIDYMQFLRLLRGTPGRRQEDLKQICLMLKDCAVETGLPILLAAQFNRTVLAEADLSPTNIGEAGDIERAASMIIGMWNRNYQGFSRDGNITKSKEKIPTEPAIYMEVLKGRKIGAGHNSIFDFNGNTGKITNRENSSQSIFG